MTGEAGRASAAGAPSAVGEAGGSLPPSALDEAGARLDALAAAESRPRGARADAWRLVAAAAVLLGGIALVRVVDRAPAAPGAPPGGHVFFVDVEGWYRRTSDEVAVLSPFDLRLDALPEGLPRDFGAWHGVDRPHDPAIDRWLRRPEVVIERTYQRADGETVWLSAFGSRGTKSFKVFEHTPDTCYPLGGWAIERFSRARLPREALPLTVNHGVAVSGTDRLVFVYFYVWDTPARDADRGVLSVRLAAPVRRSDAATMTVLAQDFLAQIIPTTLGWARF